MSNSEVLRSLFEISNDNSFAKAKNSFKKGFKPGKQKLVKNTRKPSELKISKSYQRSISSAAIMNYRQFDPSLATVIVVSVRPQCLGGDILVVDGQHTAMMGLLSQEDVDLDTLELHHAEDSSLEEVQEAEARLFDELNTKRKNPTRIDLIRTGIFLRRVDALRFEQILKACNLQIDGIGSENGDTVTSNTGARIIKAIDQYGEDYASYIVRAVNFMRDTWGSEQNPLTEIRDDMIHGLTALFVFLDHAGKVKGGSPQGLNGKKKQILTWMIKYMGNTSMRKYYHNTAGGNTHYKIVHNIIKEYNYWAEENAPTLIISKDYLHQNGIIDPERIMTVQEAAMLPRFPKDIS